MLSLLFAISFKLFWTSKKAGINSFCCFLFLSYGKKGLSRGTRLMPTASLDCLQTTSVFLKRQLQKHFFCLKFDFTTIFELTQQEVFV